MYYGNSDTVRRHPEMSTMPKKNEPGEGLHVSGPENGREQVAWPDLFLGCSDAPCDCHPSGHVV